VLSGLSVENARRRIKNFVLSLQVDENSAINYLPVMTEIILRC
jgi:hypothetical protein